jgi:hypothetical protein
VTCASRRNPSEPRSGPMKTTALPPNAASQAPMAAATPPSGRRPVVAGAAASKQTTSKEEDHPQPRALSGSAPAAVAGEGFTRREGEDESKDPRRVVAAPREGRIEEGASGEVEAGVRQWLGFGRGHSWIQSFAKTAYRFPKPAEIIFTFISSYHLSIILSCFK